MNNLSQNIQRGKDLYFNKEYLEAIGFFETVLESTEAEAQTLVAEACFYMGNMYFLGHGVEKNLERSFGYYLKGAERGHARCQAYAGHALFHGLGIPIDYQLARDYLAAAAEKGNRTALYELGKMLIQGKGAYNNEDTIPDGIVMLHQAVESGSAIAMFELAQIYAAGELVPRDLKKALKLYKKAQKAKFDGVENLETLISELTETIERLEREKNEPPTTPVLGFSLDFVNSQPDIELVLKELEDCTQQLFVSISGAAGCGKSALAEFIAETLGRSILRVSLAGAFSLTHIQDLHRAFEEAYEHQSLLLIEEIPYKEAGLTALDYRKLLQVFLEDFELHNLPVIWTHSQKELPKELKDSATHNVNLLPLTAEQLAQYFWQMFSRKLPDTVAALNDVLIGDLERIVRILQLEDNFDDTTIEKVFEKELVDVDSDSNHEKFNQQKGRKEKRRKRKIPDTATGVHFDVNLVNASMDISNLVARLSKTDKSNFSILNYGPPGGGKSLFLRYLAEQLGFPILEVRFSDIISKWVGESEQNIAAIFKQGMHEQAFLVIDEIEGLISDRRFAEREWEVSKVNEMLTWMETYPYPFAGTTNYIEQIDRAAIRRFFLKIEFDYLLPTNIDAAYSLFFKRPAPAEALALDFLMPSDFSLVKRKAELFDVMDSDKEIVELLKEEVAVKDIYVEKPSIGF